MQKYFVVEPGASPHGPYAKTMVKRAFEHRMYPPGTKVWWEGAPEWVPIEAIFGSKTQHTVPAPPPRGGQANYTHSVSPPLRLERYQRIHLQYETICLL